MISIDNLTFQYPQSGFFLSVPSLEIADGEKIAFVGPSGCGKTTLLNLIAGIAVPQSGSVVTAGQKISTLTDAARRNFRAAHIGLVFQQFELIDYLDVTTNVLLPFYINQSLKVKPSIRQRAVQLAGEMGLSDKLNRYPDQLSQGEQQRVAICRALVTQPKIILADEPTGNLDPVNKQAIMQLMSSQAERHGQSLIVVTHDMEILADMDRTLDFGQFHQQPNVAKGPTP